MHRICNKVTYVQMNAKPTKLHDRATAMQSGFLLFLAPFVIK